MHGAQSLRLASVIPDERGRQLSPNDDALVVEFHQLFIEPASQRIGRIRVRVGPTAVTPNDWMSEEAADLLRRFVACANPRTVPAHPLDLQRRNAFVIASHRGGAALSATQLRAWLGDEAGWDDRTTLRLATLYEQERALLEQNDLPPG